VLPKPLDLSPAPEGRLSAVCLTHTFIIFQPPYWGERECDTMLSERQKQSYHRIYRKTCPVCGAEFETFNGKVRYDSHICSRRAKKGKQL
jgi:hypothetical protein